MLLTRVRRVQPGDTVLVHAAAGGWGRCSCNGQSGSAPG